MADTSRPDNDPAVHDPSVVSEDERAIAQIGADQVADGSAEHPAETSVPGFEFPGDRARQTDPKQQDSKQQNRGKSAGLLRSLQWLSLAITLPFLALNGLAAWQVRALTNYRESNLNSSPPLFTQPPLKRLGAFVFGVTVPRPRNHYSPADIGAAFENHRIDLGNGEFLEGWYVPPVPPSSDPAAPASSESASPPQADAAAEATPPTEDATQADAEATTESASAAAVILPEPASTSAAQQESEKQKATEKKGIVLLFPAYAASKQTLLQEIKMLRRLGYASFAVDLRGAGDSSGSDTTLGRREAADVAVTVDYVVKTFENPPIALYGRLLGAGYIMRAIAEFDLQPQALILEDPPAQLFGLTQAAVESVGLPRSPTSQMLTFWGGLLLQDEPGAYDPISYAAQITAPTLVLYGSEDSWVSLDEIVGVHSQLQGQKEILGLPADRLTPTSATAYGPWLERVGAFLDSHLSAEK